MKTKRSAYFVIEFEDLKHLRPLKPFGPFDSIQAAEQWLKDDAKSLLEGSDEHVARLDAATWAPPAHIVKVVKTVRQVPTYEVKIALHPVR